MNGIISVYKEPGYTSFDVVAKLRGIVGQKKIGHTGTLDPDAEGVLVVCLGNTTKLSEMITDKDKEYTAEMILGVTTDTEDASGKVLSEKEVKVSEEEIRSAVTSFIGESYQVPPMYSALKKDGVRLYELARKGVEVEREARRISIYSLDIISIDMPKVTFRVTCSKGTYIRSLCRDIGEKLECGAHMKRLIRNRVSGFTTEDSFTLSRLQELKDEGRLSQAVIPVTKLFPDLPIYRTESDADRLLYNGNPLSLKMVTCQGDNTIKNDGDIIFVKDSEDELKGMYKVDERRHMLAPFKMLL
ncbi:MAG: tRNA pseudouridine(55) synthase TruB [Lachnospiraceae bacterium]|nr:tRNA pseudouridine(55) synthase TruB [Lachnospiraceae bacterium]